MKENKVALIVRIKGSFNNACRCINSILRQSSSAYQIYGVVYGETLASRLHDEYPDINFSTVADNKGCKNMFNRIASETDSKYCMLVGSDSILSVNAVERILKYEDDLIIFNIAKANDNDKFKPFYPASCYRSVAAFMARNLCVWTAVYKTDFISKNNIRLKGIGYEKQALFMMLCMSLAESVALCKDVFLYKWNIAPKEEISDMFYYKNKADIKRIIKGFVAKGDNEARIQAVKVLLLASIQESYSRPFLRRMKKMVSLVKLIWF